jgi:hypothetical protein
MTDLFNVIQLIVICIAISPLAAVIADILHTIQAKSKAVNIIILIFSYILSCSKCFSFWFTLIYTGNLFVSAATSIIISIIEIIKNQYFDTKTTL